MSKITNDGLTTWLNPVWHRMLYSCTHMATVGVKGLIELSNTGWCNGQYVVVPFFASRSLTSLK